MNQNHSLLNYKISRVIMRVIKVYQFYGCPNDNWFISQVFPKTYFFLIDNWHQQRAMYLIIYRTSCLRNSWTTFACLSEQGHSFNPFTKKTYVFRRCVHTVVIKESSMWHKCHSITSGVLTQMQESVCPKRENNWRNYIREESKL